MGKVAFVFPGQGSQYAGMGKDLIENFSASRKVFEEADDAIGFSISQLCFEGPEDKLKLTEITQPALLTTSIAAFAALQQEGDALFNFCAGHSLGEYSALVAAGMLSLKDAVVAVHKRGKFMQEAVPVGHGAMAAIIGLEDSIIQTICEEIGNSSGIVTPANFNAPGQVVIAGQTAAVEKAVEKCKEVGARKVVLLPVSAPFHCSMMMPAQEKLQAELLKIQFKDTAIPVITNVDAKIINSGEEARDALIRQVSSPVRWVESIRNLTAEGADTFVEIGPGKVLSGLIKRIDKSVRTYNIEGAETLDKFLTKEV